MSRKLDITEAYIQALQEQNIDNSEYDKLYDDWVYMVSIMPSDVLDDYVCDCDVDYSEIDGTNKPDLERLKWLSDEADWVVTNKVFGESKKLKEEFTIDTFNNKYNPLYNKSVEIQDGIVYADNIKLRGSGINKRVEAKLKDDELRVDNEEIGFTYDGQEIYNINGQYWFKSNMESDEEYYNKVLNAVINLYKDMKKLQGTKQTESKKQLTERKKYWPPEHHIYEIDGHNFDFECLYYEVSGSNQASLWGHTVSLYMDDSLISTYTIPYYNRTWETFKFQLCMLNALSTYKDACARELYNKYRQENNVRGINQSVKDDILNNNEWYQMLQKLYNMIQDGNKGKITENKELKAEGQLWGEDADYDREMYGKMQNFANQLVTNLTNSGWDYDDTSAKYGHYRFKKGNTNIEYCDNVDKVGYASITSNNVDILKQIADEVDSDYYDGSKYVSIDFNWITPNVTNIVDILNNNAELKTEDIENNEDEIENDENEIENDENEIENDEPDEYVSLLSKAQDELPQIGVEEWGKDDELYFLADTKKLLSYLDNYEVEIPKQLYDDADYNDWSNGIDDYLEDYIGIDSNSGNSDNTYNWGARITHDLEVTTYDMGNPFYVKMSAHIGGDVRGNYTTEFLLKFDSREDFFETFADICYQELSNEIEIDGKHYLIQPEFWSEYVSIWCEEDNSGWEDVYCENIENLKNIIATEEPTDY